MPNLKSTEKVAGLTAGAVLLVVAGALLSCFVGESFVVPQSGESEAVAACPQPERSFAACAVRMLSQAFVQTGGFADAEVVPNVVDGPLEVKQIDGSTDGLD